ncbi:MAG: dihydroorotate dehydrogenase-like protein [Anaerolinea sp.]|nr:dihydroorotate dehydrogenase-like protein [Anaerolinea sp.]MCC6973489.1 dihydroorotate dehydrogenase-like protein [Anaerolineae bacterium]CAG1004722.1 dihydroorotate dehydrogenase (fumarate) [Anaerolineae bacterium]
MVDLATNFMGIKLKNPLVVSASTISGHVDTVKAAEAAGAAGLVIRSLFEEQIALESQRMADQISQYNHISPEASSYFPAVKHGGPKEHLMWVEKTRKAVKMPLFASLNAVTPGAWVQYAKELADTGVNGLEINFYYVAADPEKSGSEIEKQLYEVVEKVRAAVTLPIAVKLSPYFTSVVNVVRELEKRGVNSVVLFNRFLQPDIDAENESIFNEMTYSTSAELRLPLRHVAILYGRTKLDLVLNTGVHTGIDAVKGLLAGASVVQFTAALLKNGIPYLSTMLVQLQDWMTEHNYKTVDDFRGSLSQKRCDDPFAFERAQYVKLLLKQSL